MYGVFSFQAFEESGRGGHEKHRRDVVQRKAGSQRHEEGDRGPVHLRRCQGRSRVR